MLDVGKLGYPEVQPWSPGPSIFDLAYEAQLRIDQRQAQAKEQMETSGKPTMWDDMETVEECNEILADPFHGKPDSVVRDVYHSGRK